MTQKGQSTPLEEALLIAGTGRYTLRVMLVTGLVLFAALLGMQVMSIVIPAAGCDLGLTGPQKGLLTSMAFSGMIFSSHLFGFLADACGRKRVMLSCNLITVCLMMLSSLAPNATFLMVLTFINGFMLGGVFTPAYVFVSEFCPANVRARGLLVSSAISSLATAYLPCMAWLIMPLDIGVPLFGDLVFTSWRLYLALLAIPNLITNLLLRKIPETPKFVLNSGNEAETMEILKTIYSTNMNKDKKEYPVESVCLDAMDRISQKEVSGSNKSMRYLKAITFQTISLFTPPFLLYTIISCVTLFGIVGVYNTVALWIPEQTRQLMIYADTHPVYNATLCDIMSAGYKNDQESGLCEINYEIFITSSIIGLLQSIFFSIFGLIAPKINVKILIVLFAILTSGSSFLLIFARSFLLTMFSLGSIVILLLTIFPICLGIAGDYFPTSLRSTATSIIMLFGRLGAAIGSQIVGSLFDSHCTTAYWAMTSILIGVVVLCIFMPLKRKCPAK